MTPDQIQGWLQIGLGGAMLAALFLGFKRIWVWGWQVNEVQQQLLEAKKERDEWKVMALGGLKAAADAAHVAKQHVTLTPEEADTALRIIREAAEDR